MIMRFLPLIFTLICASVPFYFSGEVVRVIEGDTVVIRHGNRTIPVCLYGIETPEAEQAYHEEAKRFTELLALGQNVTVTVGMVNLPDGKILNLELVRNGLAWWSRKYAPDDSTIANLESEAKAKKIGLWAQRKPNPPWEMREKLAKDLEPDKGELKEWAEEEEEKEKEKEKRR